MITRYDPDGGPLDEIVGPARHVHLERMDEGAWSIVIVDDTGEEWRVWISARRPGTTQVLATVTDGPEVKP
jgi:predicted NUDIX family NTP pyrophosphohydrolase